MRLINSDELALKIDPRLLVEALRRGHKNGTPDNVERILLTDGEGDEALTWAGWERSQGIAVKTATVFPENSKKGERPNIQSVVVLFDGDNGAPLAAIHGESFTRMKTAADSALAGDILAVREPDTIAVLGAGGQAATHIKFHLSVRPSISRVLLWNRTLEAAARLAEELSFPGVELKAVKSAEAAVREASIVTCVTSSRTPVLEGHWLRDGTHVDLVGSYTPSMRESDDAVVRRGRLFVDTRRFGIFECGDYAQPINAGVICSDDIRGDLFDLCREAVVGRSSEADVTVFKNGGGGHLDLMVARAIYDFAVRDEDRSLTY